MRGGLTLAQASLYEALVQHGSLNARRAGFIAGVPRTLGYKILSELEGLGLVLKKDAPGKVAEFSAAHPLKLKELADKKFDEAREAKEALERALVSLVADFNAADQQHGHMYVIKSQKALDLQQISTLLTLYKGELITVPPPLQESILEDISKI